MLVHFSKATVFITEHGTDEIFLEVPSMPNPISGFSEPTRFSCKVTKGKGVEWVRTNLGVEPEVYNPYGLKVD